MISRTTLFKKGAGAAFAVWRAVRAVGDHDLNSFLVRADPSTETPSLEPGMTVWIDRGPTNQYQS